MLSSRVVALPRLTWLQRIVILLLGLLVADGLIAATTGYVPMSQGVRVLLAIGLFALLPFAVLPPFVRRFTWRVRYRLILTYFLAGVLPIFLVFLFVHTGLLLVLGQMANYILHQELAHRQERLYVSTRQGEAGVNSRSLAQIPEWSEPGFKGLVRDRDGQYYVAAHVAGPDGGVPGVFVVQPIDNAFLAGLLPGIGSIRLIEGQTLQFRVGARRTNPNMKTVLDSEETSPAPTALGFWDSDLESGSPLRFRSLETGREDAGAVIVYTHPSAIVTRVFSTLGNVGGVLLLFMGVIAGAFLLVEVAAVIACIRLARTITGTVHDLHEGTKKVEAGDFSHRIPVRSNDQLSELAASFNGMTQRVEQLIGEVKEKEKLESELEIARQVQTQLFPKEVPKLATLELAGVCNPARVVSGDYYDFIPTDSGGAAVVIGDISGKGISAALLMASVQASLHAQLSMGTGSDVSTSALVTRLNRQLYANTPPEKYATFYCAVYDARNSRLSYTNAGHLAPILIRNGEVLRLESNGTVVGIFPEYPFEQCDVNLMPGDLLAAFTDGITESENAQEEQFGEQRLIELLRANVGRPLDEIIQNVMNAVGRWAHDPSMRDDITMLLARKL